MQRGFLSTLAAAVPASPLRALATRDDSQKQLMQRSMDARRKLDAARSATSCCRNTWI